MFRSIIFFLLGLSSKVKKWDEQSRVLSLFVKKIQTRFQTAWFRTNLVINTILPKQWKEILQDIMQFKPIPGKCYCQIFYWSQSLENFYVSKSERKKEKNTTECQDCLAPQKPSNFDLFYRHQHFNYTSMINIPM